MKRRRGTKPCSLLFLPCVGTKRWRKKEATKILFFPLLLVAEKRGEEGGHVMERRRASLIIRAPPFKAL